MYWDQTGSQMEYHDGQSRPPSETFGNFHSTAHFSNNNYNIVSNATISDVKLSHNDILVYCYSISSIRHKIIKVAGITTVSAAINQVKLHSYSA